MDVIELVEPIRSWERIREALPDALHEWGARLAAFGGAARTVVGEAMARLDDGRRSLEPGARVAGAIAGAALIGTPFRRRDPLTLATSVIGAIVFVRAIAAAARQRHPAPEQSR